MQFSSCIDELNKISNLYNRNQNNNFTQNNIFKILGVNNFEIRHSYFLKWLFDSKINDNLNNYFLKEFIYLLAQKFTIDLTSILKVIDENNYKVYREYNNIDLLIELPSDKLKKYIIVIENKIYSDEQGNQLTKYYNFINTNKNYKDFNKIFIFLNPNGIEPKNSFDKNNWITIDYKLIYFALKKSLEKLKKIKLVNNKILCLIKDYMEVVGVIINQNDETMKAMWQFYQIKENRNIFDMFNQLKPDYSKRKIIIEEFCDNNNILYKKKSKQESYIDLYFPKINEIAMKKDLGENLIYGQISNNTSFDYPSITFYLSVNNNSKEINDDLFFKIKNIMNVSDKSKGNTDKSLISVKLMDCYEWELDEKEKLIKIINSLTRIFNDKNGIYNKILHFISEYNLKK